MTTSNNDLPSNFIHKMIEEDLENNRYGDRVHTRFPPEPNGYLHIGHAKAICLNFTTSAKYGGKCNLRFDDTNPSAEEMEFVDNILKDIHWLGFDWEDRLYYASDYFDKLYEFAVILINKGKAYVDDLSPEEIREYRGSLTKPGKDSPYRDRSVEENLDLFERMRKGEFEEGSRVLRAKIDMQSGNINLRDPVIYRILKAKHHQTGDKWCIYPMYDYAHPISDALEGITHSLCSLEYEDHRPLYNWFLEEVGVFEQPTRQIEFARLNLSRTVMSKRKLRALVEAGLVDGWDDPRMPTIAGLRRRGYTPESIQDFAERIGVAKANSVVDVALLEHCIREDLNAKAPRAMAVLRPLKVIIDNYPEDQVEELESSNHPNNPEMGSRTMPFTREIYIEQEDFMENPPSKFYRMTPGKEVRLLNAYIIKCESVVKDENGEIVEVHCTYDPGSKSGGPTAGRKVKGTLHWVSASHSVPAEIRIYDYLLNEEDMNDEDEDDFKAQINSNSLEILKDAQVEPSLKSSNPGDRFQFMRQGYFVQDIRDSRPDHLVFNLIVNLRDTWAKMQKNK